MVTDKYYQFANSIQGFNHRIRNLPNQDNYHKLKNQSGLLVIAVADGHGSEPLSQYGSEFAVKLASECITQFVEQIKQTSLYQEKFNVFSKNTNIYCGINPLVKNDNLKYSKPFIIDDKNNYQEIKKDSEDYDVVSNIFSQLSQLEKSIVYQWNSKIEECFNYLKNKNKLKEIGIDESDNNHSHLFGTTLLAAVITDEYWFAIQIGDGTCIALFDEDKVNNEFKQINQPIPDDERCYSNVTTSICDSDSYLEFRHCFGTKLPKALFLGSDGIDNSFTNKDRNQELQDLKNFYIGLIPDFGTDDSRDEKLKEKLADLTKDYSGDDVTIAGLIDNSWISNKKQFNGIKINTYKKDNVNYPKEETNNNTYKNDIGNNPKEKPNNINKNDIGNYPKEKQNNIPSYKEIPNNHINKEFNNIEKELPNFIRPVKKETNLPKKDTQINKPIQEKDNKPLNGVDDKKSKSIEPKPERENEKKAEELIKRKKQEDDLVDSITKQSNLESKTSDIKSNIVKIKQNIGKINNDIYNDIDYLKKQY